MIGHAALVDEDIVGHERMLVGLHVVQVPHLVLAKRADVLGVGRPHAYRAIARARYEYVRRVDVGQRCDHLHVSTPHFYHFNTKFQLNRNTF